MKDRFLEISSIRKQIQELFHRLEDKKKGMKDNYSTLVASNDNHFFGLDSFRFQVKLTENELTFLNDQFVLIDNRLYCDYYKLYNHVYDYYVENLPPGLVKSVFPIYKDLEPTKVYETELVHKLYKDILTLIHKAYDTLEHEHRKRESEKRLTTSGIHIGNYVHNRVFTDTLIKTNIELFEQYLNTYFIYHMTFLVNLKERLGMFLDHVLRRQPVEQGCHVDELDDNFVGVVRDDTEPVLVETFHSISRDAKPEPEVKTETTDSAVEEAEAKSETNSEAVEEPTQEPETKTETNSEAVEEPTQEPETKTETNSEEVEEPTQEPETKSETNSEEVEEPTQEPETKSETNSEEVEAPMETNTEEVDEPKPELSEEVAPVVQVEAPLEVDEPNPELSEEVAPTQEEPETNSDLPVEEPEPSKEVPLTVEEVLNPIIEHILKGTEPSQEPAKKKKRSRKK
jgi:hypothetical protein